MTASTKKQWEIRQGQLVADSINEREATDYLAFAAEREPADVLLQSKSGKHPNIPAQVVTVPLDYRHRDDKDSVKKIRSSLMQVLSASGLRHCFVGLSLSSEAQMQGMRDHELARLAELIVSEASRDCVLRFNEIEEWAPDLARLVHTILLRQIEIPEVEVSIPFGSAVPLDGRWIEEGIQYKAQHYGGPDAVRDLMLVIVAAGFIDMDQVVAFQATHPPETLPFLEIWITTPFDGSICLKRKDGENAYRVTSIPRIDRIR